MMLASMTEPDGNTLLLIGLSRENTKRLHEGRPIEITHAKCFEIPEKFKIVICAGETELTMKAELESLIGPDTKVTVDPRLK